MADRAWLGCRGPHNAQNITIGASNPFQSIGQPPKPIKEYKHYILIPHVTQDIIKTGVWPFWDILGLCDGKGPNLRHTWPIFDGKTYFGLKTLFFLCYKTPFNIILEENVFVEKLFFWPPCENVFRPARRARRARRGGQNG